MTTFLVSLLLLCCPTRIRAVETDNTIDPVDCPQKYTLSIPEAAVMARANKDKLIIAHRGASFHLPEHTIAAYRLALELGADFVEPDLVATKDGRLIALHTVDLNVTTNVVEKFGKTRQPWFSPFVNRSGYWTFNYTLAEIKQLRVRQRLPRARTTAFDGLFQIPTLLEIQSLVNDWNSQRISELLRRFDANGTTELPPLQRQQTAGVYAELKSSPWFQQDANMSLVELLMQEIAKNPQVFESILRCPEIFKFDEYTVPPLVVQCFDGPVLQDLTEQWKVHPVFQHAPIPPMILLIGAANCWEESIWFEIGDTWRAYIQGLGMDKACFPKVGAKVEEGKAVKEQAEEFNLVIHPWTERPEHEFLMEGFEDILEETRYLLCTIGAQAIFSESVETAVMAVRMGCDDEEKEGGNIEGSSLPPSASAAMAGVNQENKGKDAKSTNGEISATKSSFSEDTSKTYLVGVASFIMGVFVTALIAMWINRGFTCAPRPPRQHQIPWADESESDRGGVDPDSAEYPPDDELL